MRVVILGGTAFIGRAITERLVADGHTVLVVHRGETEPADLPEVAHLHVDRERLPSKRAEIEAFAPNAAVEVYAMNAADSQAGLDALPDGIRLVAISSGDVYRAFDGLNSGRQTDPLPLDETAPLRTRFFVAGERYENIEVEAAYAERGATILRLGAVYGPHDDQRRFDFVLRRLLAGRKRIPIGAGQFLFSKVYVRDVATAVVCALTEPGAVGETFNVVERRTPGFRLLAEQILDAASARDVELVEVPDAVLPSDLAITRTLRQHLLMDAAKARSVLGWTETEPERALAEATQWYLAHPADDRDDDFSADDAALNAAD